MGIRWVLTKALHKWRRTSKEMNSTLVSKPSLREPIYLRSAWHSWQNPAWNLTATCGDLLPSTHLFFHLPPHNLGTQFQWRLNFPHLPGEGYSEGALPCGSWPLPQRAVGCRFITPCHRAWEHSGWRTWPAWGLPLGKHIGLVCWRIPEWSLSNTHLGLRGKGAPRYRHWANHGGS